MKYRKSSLEARTKLMAMKTSLKWELYAAYMVPAMKASLYLSCRFPSPGCDFFISNGM